MIFKLFSRRQLEAAEKDTSDVFRYDEVSSKLRVQTQQILSDAIGRYYVPSGYDMGAPTNNNQAWDVIKKTVSREIGKHELSSDKSNKRQILDYLAKCDAAEFIDAMDVVAAYLERVLKPIPEYRLDNLSIKQPAADAIIELNYRFLEDGFGFQIEDGQIFRIESEFTHREVTIPALRILSDKGFEGARDEFLEAHRFYMNREYKQCAVIAANCLESTLKSVCKLKCWTYDKGDRATELLKIVRANGLWPDYLDASFDQLASTLASGLPKIRNHSGAHGQGPVPELVPDFVARYALNLCASKVTFIVNAATQQ